MKKNYYMFTTRIWRVCYIELYIISREIRVGIEWL